MKASQQIIKVLILAPLFAGAPVVQAASAPPGSNLASGWSSTRFWQAPVMNSLGVKIKDPNAELNVACDAFEKLAMSSVGLPTTYRKQMFDGERTTALKSQFPSTSFSVQLETDLREDGSVLSQLDHDVLAQVAQDRSRVEDRVLYTQETDAEILDINSLGLILVRSSPGSLVEVAKSLGLQNLPVKMISGGAGVRILISSRDLACDLVRGRASLVVNGKATARISVSSQVQLRTFFGRVSELAQSALSQFQKPNQRASVLGLRIGALFAGLPGITRERAEVAMLAELESHFDPVTIDANTNWSVPGFSDPFNLTLNIQH